MPVVAMTREMGSGGRLVAQGVAERMGLTMILHEVVEHDLAEHMHVRESAVHHRLEGGASLVERWQIGSKSLAHYTTEEVLELAGQGNVLIRGWGACVILRDVPHVVRVRICAPMEARLRAVADRFSGNSKDAAQRALERNDDAHKRILRQAYGVDRESPLHYDLVLNTERCSIEACTSLVCALAESPEFRETEASRARLNDKLLEAHIRIKLRERFTVGMGVSEADVSAAGGRVVLTGKAIHSQLVADAKKIVEQTPGVTSVINRMEVVHGPPRVFA